MLTCAGMSRLLSGLRHRFIQVIVWPFHLLDSKVSTDFRLSFWRLSGHSLGKSSGSELGLCLVVLAITQTSLFLFPNGLWENSEGSHLPRLKIGSGHWPSCSQIPELKERSITLPHPLAWPRQVGHRDFSQRPTRAPTLFISSLNLF